MKIIDHVPVDEAKVPFVRKKQICKKLETKAAKMQKPRWNAFLIYSIPAQRFLVDDLFPWVSTTVEVARYTGEECSRTRHAHMHTQTDVLYVRMWRRHGTWLSGKLFAFSSSVIGRIWTRPALWDADWWVSKREEIRSVLRGRERKFKRCVSNPWLTHTVTVVRTGDCTEPRKRGRKQNAASVCDDTSRLPSSEVIFNNPSTAPPCSTIPHS